MPRFYPEKDAEFYAERLVFGSHDTRPSVLRRCRAQNRVRWFRDPSEQDKHRSTVCSWGSGKTFERNTGLNCRNFLKTRERSKCKLPTPGRRGLWKITRVGPAGMCNLPLHTWQLKDWLKSERLNA